ncbi:MAG: NAD(P)(+) transhydrogenase (Re/Si-specific) subunit beta [Candidatus Melainabacteria bacterium]|nr:NAD(P)(+) transhydrogenase (Re/Si-specific) subunit beta [Candidatus Melainabacteria bacterium]
MRENIINLSYLISAILFIIGLKMLSSPKTARPGNFYSSFGMLIAICATLLDKHIVSFHFIIIGLIIGSIIGAFLAITVKMTQMPQMVGLLNGYGGLASALVAVSEYMSHYHNQTLYGITTTTITLIIGAITFTGSVMAYAKLEGLVSGQPITYPFQKTLNLLQFFVIVGGSIFLCIHPQSFIWFIVVGVISFILGCLLVLPIGGADMPVVICLLNSYSGMAGCAAGFILSNYCLIITGALVGASGIILTQIMCKAMNRSMTNVMFGAFGKVDSSSIDKTKAVTVQGYTPDDALVILENASLVIIVPGYGMAVSQAQHNVRELADILEKKGATVKYAIHPVAGRMPGHMNILLAEANVPYEKLYEMDNINPEFERADAALVIGANDVTNPAAKNNPKSPIYGMPILEVEKAKTVIFLKRSMAPGFAGIENELFLMPKTMMLFGDAKDTVVKLVNLLK